MQIFVQPQSLFHMILMLVYIYNSDYSNFFLSITKCEDFLP